MIHHTEALESEWSATSQYFPKDEILEEGAEERESSMFSKGLFEAQQAFPNFGECALGCSWFVCGDAFYIHTERMP